jgi:hypothetical protein
MTGFPTFRRGDLVRMKGVLPLECRGKEMDQPGRGVVVSAVTRGHAKQYTVYFEEDCILGPLSGADLEAAR